MKRALELVEDSAGNAILPPDVERCLDLVAFETVEIARRHRYGPAAGVAVLAGFLYYYEPRTARALTDRYLALVTGYAKRGR